MKKYLPLLLCVAATGCFAPEPVSRKSPENNAGYKVDYLFEHDGCKVYRFYDRGEYIYFTNCNGQTIAKADSTTRLNTTRITAP